MVVPGYERVNVAKAAARAAAAARVMGVTKATRERMVRPACSNSTHRFRSSTALDT